jgi:hypothetical protein
VVVVGDEQLLTGRALLSAFLQSKGFPACAEPRTELDAKVGVGDLNSSGASRVDELLSRRVVTGGTIRRNRTRDQQSGLDERRLDSHADSLVLAWLSVRHGPAKSTVVGCGPEDRPGANGAFMTAVISTDERRSEWHRQGIGLTETCQTGKVGGDEDRTVHVGRM